jgi:copper chaperone NosL
LNKKREDEMKKISRIIVIAVSILLVTGFFLPIWEITLDAPQYPEGLGMNIWINKITGDLQTINGLNHYIGMKKIEPDSIKELKMMPYFLGALIALGLIAGISGKKKLLTLWVAVFIIAGAAGAIDFYMWEYDYGHNLNPEAAIKVPGMSYQPPLIGSKQLLNFTANSYPDTGGMAVIAVGLIAVLVLLYEIKFNKEVKTVKSHVYNNPRIYATDKKEFQLTGL